MNSEIAYLLGALRDGCFSELAEQGIYRVRLYQKNKAWLDALAEIIEKNFGVQPYFYLDKRRNVWCISVTSKQFFNQIKKLSEYPADQASWFTPTWIQDGLAEIKKAYARGFFDAEGSINSLEKFGENHFSRKDIRIYFAQANKRALEELRAILLELGIRCGKVCGPYVKKGTKTKMYGLMIHGSGETLNFYDIVGSFHLEKVNRFELLKSVGLGDKDSSVASPRSVWLPEGKVL